MTVGFEPRHGRGDGRVGYAHAIADRCVDPISGIVWGGRFLVCFSIGSGLDGIAGVEDESLLSTRAGVRYRKESFLGAGLSFLSVAVEWATRRSTSFQQDGREALSAGTLS